ncbi:MAG: ribosome maturation factor RimM [Burkholderiales bacterium]
MGRVAGSHGVRGWIKVVPGRGVGETLAGAREWWIAAAPYEVSEARPHGATVLAKLAGLETREQALALKGERVSLERAALGEPAEGHFFLTDLIGLEVRNEADQILGTVRQWFSNGAQDLMEVAGERTRLIPWVRAIVKDVDLEERRIVVDWDAQW